MEMLPKKDINVTVFIKCCYNAFILYYLVNIIKIDSITFYRISSYKYYFKYLKNVHFFKRSSASRCMKCTIKYYVVFQYSMYVCMM